MATSKSTKVLEMVFKTNTGKEAMYSLSNPKADLTKATVEAYMTNCITKKVFANKSGTLESIVKTQIVATTVTALA